MQLLVPSVVVGGIIGLVYALSGAGLVVIYRSSEVINFAQGDLAAVGLYVAYSLGASNQPYWLIAVATVAVAVALGLACGAVLSLPVARSWSVLEVGLATIAASFLIEGGLTQTSGAAALSFPSLDDTVVFHLGDVGISVTDLATVAVSLTAFLALGVWFRYSRVGLAMRACSESPEAARWFGVPAGRLRLISWGVAGSLAGLAGLFIAPLYSLTPSSMDTVLVFGFASVVTGGFQSISGALVAGVSIGILTNLTAAYVSVNLITPVMFVVMLATLVFRPYGLFGRQAMARV